jgi:hypothetical protein
VSAVVVVSGRSGSGKTTLSRALCRGGDFRYVNVGDLLLEKLERLGAAPSTRTEIGPRFLELRGLDEYLQLLDEAATQGTVVDGLRIAAGLARLRASGLAVIHLFRVSSPAMTAEPRFEGDAARLRKDADRIIPWEPNVDVLRRSAVDLNAELLIL